MGDDVQLGTDDPISGFYLPFQELGTIYILPRRFIQRAFRVELAVSAFRMDLRRRVSTGQGVPIFRQPRTERVPGPNIPGVPLPRGPLPRVPSPRAPRPNAPLPAPPTPPAPRIPLPQNPLPEVSLPGTLRPNRPLPFFRRRGRNPLLLIPLIEALLRDEDEERR